MPVLKYACKDCERVWDTVGGAKMCESQGKIEEYQYEIGTTFKSEMGETIQWKVVNRYINNDHTAFYIFNRSDGITNRRRAQRTIKKYLAKGDWSLVDIKETCEMTLIDPAIEHTTTAVV